jgi:hypothetical protein
VPPSCPTDISWAARIKNYFLNKDFTAWTDGNGYDLRYLGMKILKQSALIYE